MDYPARRTRIRKARLGDLPTLMLVEKASWGPELLYERVDLKHKIKTGRIIVFAIPQPPFIVGYAEFRVRDGVGTLESVAVLPARRKEGIGRALVFSAIRRMREEGATCVELECDTNLNLWYLGLGFEVSGFYSTGIANAHKRLCMRKLVG